jgi:hypothetical protein
MLFLRVRMASTSIPSSIPKAPSAAHHDPSYRLLRYLDPYGDAVFNWLQVSDLLADLQLAGSRAWSDAERSTLAQVAALVARAHEEPRLYVRFMGD